LLSEVKTGDVERLWREQSSTFRRGFSCPARALCRRVRAAYAAVFETFPDAHWASARHFIAADRGVSEWTFSGTRRDGKRVVVNGCDLFTLCDGKISVKDSFRKNRPAI
jgi:hypothetical protein